jgi:hypothetical protein
MGQRSQREGRGGNRAGDANIGGRHQFGRGQGRKSRNCKAGSTSAQTNATDIGAAVASSADSTKEDEISVLKRQATELSRLLQKAKTRLAELEAGAAQNATDDSSDS